MVSANCNAAHKATGEQFNSRGFNWIDQYIGPIYNVVVIPLTRSLQLSITYDANCTLEPTGRSNNKDYYKTYHCIF
jgi:hypothetical protein